VIVDTIKNEDISELVAFIRTYKSEQNKQITEIQTNKIKDEIFQIINNNTNSYGFKCINESKKIIGYIILHIINFPMLCGKELYISDLFVDNKDRGKGIGKKLLSFAEDIAVKNKCERLILNNPKEYESYKRSFYSKFGFVERIEFANFIKNL